MPAEWDLARQLQVSPLPHQLEAGGLGWGGQGSWPDSWSGGGMQ